MRLVSVIRWLRRVMRIAALFAQKRENTRNNGRERSFLEGRSEKVERNGDAHESADL